MMVPTGSPASARVRLPGTRPFITCTWRTWRADLSRSRTVNSRIESCSPLAFISVTEIFGMKVATLDEVNTLFTNRSGIKVVASYAATSALMKQIEQGAPADVFLSADVDWMDYGAKQQSSSSKRLF